MKPTLFAVIGCTLGIILMQLVFVDTLNNKKVDEYGAGNEFLGFQGEVISHNLDTKQITVRGTRMFPGEEDMTAIFSYDENTIWGLQNVFVKEDYFFGSKFNKMSESQLQNKSIIHIEREQKTGGRHIKVLNSINFETS